ncbi:unnamed protein product [Amoebophrya sp. A120]|nr:unnamed protein product [Amoebophrya sp. A120]|eukprot:GSA120T00017615001.1
MSSASSSSSSAGPQNTAERQNAAILCEDAATDAGPSPLQQENVGALIITDVSGKERRITVPLEADDAPPPVAILHRDYLGPFFENKLMPPRHRIRWLKQETAVQSDKREEETSAPEQTVGDGETRTDAGVGAPCVSLTSHGGQEKEGYAAAANDGRDSNEKAPAQASQSDLVDDVDGLASEVSSVASGRQVPVDSDQEPLEVLVVAAACPGKKADAGPSSREGEILPHPPPEADLPVYQFIVTGPPEKHELVQTSDEAAETWLYDRKYKIEEYPEMEDDDREQLQECIATVIPLKRTFSPLDEGQCDWFFLKWRLLSAVLRLPEAEWEKHGWNDPPPKILQVSKKGTKVRTSPTPPTSYRQAYAVRVVRGLVGKCPPSAEEDFEPHQNEVAEKVVGLALSLIEKWEHVNFQHLLELLPDLADSWSEHQAQWNHDPRPHPYTKGCVQQISKALDAWAGNNAASVKKCKRVGDKLYKAIEHHVKKSFRNFLAGRCIYVDHAAENRGNGDDFAKYCEQVADHISQWVNVFAKCMTDTHPELNLSDDRVETLRGTVSDFRKASEKLKEYTNHLVWGVDEEDEAVSDSDDSDDDGQVAAAGDEADDTSDYFSPLPLSSLF